MRRRFICIGVIASIAFLAEVSQLYTADYSLLPGPLGSFPPGTLVWNPSTSGTLGPFGNGEVNFFGMDLWGDVPGHGSIPATGAPWRLEISFDLTLGGNWYGNGDATHGPSLVGLTDYWPYTGDNTATLLHTTFSRGVPIFNQAYPGSFPSGSYPPGTGSNGPSLYHLSYDVPDLHVPNTGTSDLFLRLAASGTNGTWSLDNVTVFAQPVPEPTVLMLLASAGLTLAGIGAYFNICFTPLPAWVNKLHRR